MGNNEEKKKKLEKAQPSLSLSAQLTLARQTTHALSEALSTRVRTCAHRAARAKRVRQKQNALSAHHALNVRSNRSCAR